MGHDTQRHILEGCNDNTHRREDLKSPHHNISTYQLFHRPRSALKVV